MNKMDNWDIASITLIVLTIIGATIAIIYSIIFYMKPSPTPASVTGTIVSDPMTNPDHPQKYEFDVTFNIPNQPDIPSTKTISVIGNPNYHKGHNVTLWYHPDNVLNTITWHQDESNTVMGNALLVPGVIALLFGALGSYILYRKLHTMDSVKKDN
jgi:hypothetical protein